MSSVDRFKLAINQTLGRMGYQIRRLPTGEPPQLQPETSPPPPPPQLGGGEPMYAHDAMALYDISLEFMRKPRFRRAYDRGMNTGHRFSQMFGSDTPDIHVEFRVHTMLWAAELARHLEGDFVECGVYTGIFSTAVCDYIDFNKIGKNFWLFDTFEGHPAKYRNPAEGGDFDPWVREAYAPHFEITKRNFAPYPKAHLVKGPVPDTLSSVSIDKVCYLSLDMNLAYPETAALEFFWPKLVPGAVVVLDDYGRAQFPLLREREDEFAAKIGCEILTMPHGQGLLIKPGNKP